MKKNCVSFLFTPVSTIPSTEFDSFFFFQNLILKKYSINICLMNARINEMKDKDEKAGWSL